LPFIKRTLVTRIMSLAEMVGVCVQEDRLWIADPKAINHILQKSGYLYSKPRNTQERASLLSGRGVVWAQGEALTVVGLHYF